ncbi:MAG: 2-polyprenyl-3-methyl-5-hydroxy-6-metoxy-1,4-benzoquinol methylase [Flavobacteriales bacterium]|jgi:2-polyprenyl-3-methyl-5-hydroxy-6-metoxy-1,4-benzoquinol methylase
MRKLCFIQAHYTNVEQGDISGQYFCVEKIRASGVFDEVVLAVGDLPENKVFIELARKWRVKCFFGSPDNMLERMRQAAVEYDCQILARVLLYWFYLDVELISNMMKLIERKNTDYINLPLNFDIKFGADVHTLSGLNKVVNVLEKNPVLYDSIKFRPWHYIEENSASLWMVETIQDVPLYSNKVHEDIAKKIIASTPWAWDYGSVFYYHEYVFATDYLKVSDIVLDLSCGWGSGTRLMADHCKHAIGVDVSDKLISAARDRHSLSNIEFVQSDGQSLILADDSVDVVVSIHTMEHVDDDELFLTEIKRVLRPNGRLLIEVPLRLRKPFIYNDNPFVPKTDSFPGHVREYSVDGFETLVGRFFSIENILGDNRGAYCDIDKARNAAMIIAVNPP